MMSTTDAQGGRREHLDRMVWSVASFAQAQPDRRMTLLLLVQRAAPDWRLEARAGLVRSVTVPGRLSLSAARNRLLDLARRDGLIEPEGIVLFPDDDCWYPPGALDAIAGTFQRDPALDLWFCRYGSAPEPIGPGDGRPASAMHVTRQASSNTMVFRGRVAGADDLLFDEDLGVGTALGGGEDTAYALNAFGRSRRAVFVDRACIGHRDPDRRFAVRYYRGALVAIARNARLPGMWRELARKMAVGLVYVLRGRLRPHTYLRDAVAALGTALRRPTASNARGS